MNSQFKETLAKINIRGILGAAGVALVGSLVGVGIIKFAESVQGELEQVKYLQERRNSCEKTITFAIYVRLLQIDKHVKMIGVVSLDPTIVEVGFDSNHHDKPRQVIRQYNVYEGGELMVTYQVVKSNPHFNEIESAIQGCVGDLNNLEVEDYTIF